MLDNTQKESNLFKSIKKHVVDNLHRGSERIYTSFGFEEERPVGEDRFVIVLLSDFDSGTVSSARASFYMFSKTDDNGELADLNDKVLDLFLDSNDPHGLRRISFVDETFTEFSKIIPYPQPSSSRQRTNDNLYMKYIDVVFRWGGK